MLRKKRERGKRRLNKEEILEQRKEKGKNGSCGRETRKETPEKMSAAPPG